MIMLDGLDEISNPAARRDLRDAVMHGMRRHPGCRWLLTSRVVGYSEVPFHSTAEEKADSSRFRDDYSWSN